MDCLQLTGQTKYSPPPPQTKLNNNKFVLGNHKISLTTLKENVFLFFLSSDHLVFETEKYHNKSSVHNRCELVMTKKASGLS